MLLILAFKLRTKPNLIPYIHPNCLFCMRDQLIKRILILVFGIVFSPMAKAQSEHPATVQFKDHLNHANSYYWLSRSRFNSVEEAQTAMCFLDTAKQLLPKTNLAPNEKKAFFNQIQKEQQELELRISASQENLNAHMPLVPFLLGYFDAQFGYFDNGAELALEEALTNLLETKLIRPSSPIKELPGFVIVESPMKDSANMVEVAKQFISSNSKLYVVADHELKGYFADSSYTLQGIGNLFNTGFVGRFNFNVQDQHNNLFYCGVRFDYYDVRKGDLMSSTYTETIMIKKDGIVLPYIKAYGLSLILLCLIFCGIGFWLSSKKGKNYDLVLKIAMGIGAGLLGGLAAGFGLQVLLKLIPIDPVAFVQYPFDWAMFFTETSTWVWPISFVVLYANIPFLVWVLSTLIFKRQLAQERMAILSFNVFSYAGLFFILGKEYTFFFEQMPTNLLVLHGFLAISITAYLHSNALYSFYKRNKTFKELAILLPSLLPLYPFLIQFLFNSPSKDFNWIFLSLSLIPALLAIFKRLPVLTLIKLKRTTNQQKERRYGMPNLLQELDAKIADRLISESVEGIVPFDSVFSKTLDELVEKPNALFHHIHIEAPSGIGKTTFLKEFINRSQANSHFAVFYGDCDEKEGTDIPYEPFYEALAELTGQGLYYSGDLVALAALEQSKPFLDGIPGGSLLNAVAEANTDATGFKGAKVREISEQIIAAFRDLNYKKGIENLVLIIEDIQWMDERSEDLLRHLWKSLLLAVEVQKSFPKITFITSSSPDSNEIRSKACSFIQEEKNFGGNGGETIATLIEGQPETIMRTIWNDSQTHLPKFTDLPTKDFVENWFREAHFLPLIDDSLLEDTKAFLEEMSGFNPRYFFQLIQFLIQSNFIIEKDNRLFASNSLQWDKIPLDSAAEVFYRNKFATLEPSLLKFLESAAFIGPQFEAAVLAKIWKLDKIELVRQLLSAEKAGLIIDLNDKDDFYSFSNKKVRHALKQFALSESKASNIPQIVKEYHKAIIGIKVGTSTLSFEQNFKVVFAWDYDLLQDLANRVLLIKKEMGESGEVILAAAGMAAFGRGESERAFGYFDPINLSNSNIWNHTPSVGKAACTTLLMAAQSGNATYINRLEQLQHHIRTILQKKSIQVDALELIGVLAECHFLICFWKRENWDQAFFNGIPESEAIEFYHLSFLDRVSRRDKTEGVNLNAARKLYETFNSNDKLRNSALYSKLLDLMAKVDLGQQPLYLSERIYLITKTKVDVNNPDLLATWINHLQIEEFGFQNLEDLAYCLSTITYSPKITHSRALKRTINEKRLEINSLIGSEWGCYLSEFELLEIGGDDWELTVLNDRFRKAFLTYGSPGQRAAIFVLWAAKLASREGDIEVGQELLNSIELLSRLIDRGQIGPREIMPVKEKLLSLVRLDGLPEIVLQLLRLLESKMEN